MLLRITLAVGLVLTCVTNVSADEPTLLDLTISTCVGPEFNAARVPYDVIAGLPEESCLRACKAAGRGCKAVVKAIDRCGASFLKAAAKTEMEVCRGLGGTSKECRAVRDDVKPDIAWWKAAGKVEQADCEADTQTLCMSRCQSAVTIVGPDFISPPLPEPPPRDAGGAIVYLEFPPPASLTEGLEFLEGEAGASLTIVQGPLLTAPLIDPETTQSDVREGARDAIEFLE